MKVKSGNATPKDNITGLSLTYEKNSPTKKPTQSQTNKQLARLFLRSF
jgi:hypothetical protein